MKISRESLEKACNAYILKYVEDVHQLQDLCIKMIANYISDKHDERTNDMKNEIIKLCIENDVKIEFE